MEVEKRKVQELCKEKARLEALQPMKPKMPANQMEFMMYCMQAGVPAAEAMTWYHKSQNGTDNAMQAGAPSTPSPVAPRMALSPTSVATEDPYPAGLAPETAESVEMMASQYAPVLPKEKRRD
eukprot:6153134-Karenia_brevis.AAC.1